MKYINQRDAYEITLHSGSYTASQKISELPSIDIVRCKDCKYRHDNSTGFWKPCREVITEDDWFCGDGKEKGT
ncbi:MAG: hypothetical protein J6S14_11870 [Clostridia bacterium]|nr:hypothetical protein [Clostridia bacterium]